MNNCVGTPEGYFNAGDMLPESTDGTKLLEPSYFLNSKKVRSRLLTLDKQPIIYQGISTCTFIPSKLKCLFIAWIALNTNYEEQQ